MIVAPLLTVEESLSHCLHCAINELAQQGFERGETDLPKIPSMIAEVIRPPDASARDQARDTRSKAFKDRLRLRSA